MKMTFFSSLLYSLLWAVLTGTAAAQSNLAGTWQGRLEVAPGKTLAIQFVIASEPGGQYSAVVTSPDDGAIKNVRAGSVKFADNRLTIDVPALSGGYAGTLRNGALEGEWTQEGTKMPLTLKPFQKAGLTPADIEALRGDWSGLFKGEGLEVTVVLRFSTGANGSLRSVMDVPEQGVKDWEAKNVSLDDGHLSVEIPAAMTKITGALKGDQITGQWNQLGKSYPLTLKKGKFVAAPVYLSLPAEVRTKLAGKWSGALGPLTMNLRFETDSQGRLIGFLAIPQQNLANIPVSAASVDGTKLAFAFAGFGAKFTAELAADTLTGEWIQLGMPQPAPLVLTREK